MQYRPLGRTGLSVSVLGFGASPLGGVFGDVDEAEGIRTVHAALDRGINFFDVAPYYGQTRAETVLGKALRTVARDRYYLATKVGRYGRDAFDFSAARVTRSVDESLQRLGVEYIDLIQCHDIEFGSLAQVVEETIPALRRVREQGKVRFIGITGLPLSLFPAVLDRADVDTVLSYCHYCLNDTTLAGLLPYLREKGVGVINAAPLAMGLLTDRGAPDWHPAPEPLKRACAEAAACCRARGTDLARLALQFAVARPDIATTLVGMADRQTLNKNVACLDEPMDTEARDAVREILRPVRALTWPSGRPENSPCA